MSLGHNTSTCHGENCAKIKKRENLKELFFFWNCMSQNSASLPPRPLVAKYLPHFVVSYVNNIKRFLDLFNCHNSIVANFDKTFYR